MRRCRGNTNSHARSDIHNTVPLITHCLCDGTIPLFFPRLPPVVAVSLVNARHAFEQIIIRYATHRREVWYGPSLLFFFHLITISFQREKERERGRKRNNERDWRILFVRRKQRTARRDTRIQLEIHYSLNCRPNAFISILITRAPCVNVKAREHCIRVILHARRTRISFVF